MGMVLPLIYLACDRHLKGTGSTIGFMLYGEGSGDCHCIRTSCTLACSVSEPTPWRNQSVTCEIRTDMVVLNSVCQDGPSSQARSL
jgi:hypothetical protein